MRSRRSSRPSWSSSALTLAAAGSLRTTPVAAVSCTVMLSSSHVRGCLLRHVLQQANTAGAEPLPTVRRRVPCGSGSAEVTRRLAAVKLRLPGRRDRTGTAPDPAADLTAQLVKTGGKGRPTPKRTEAQDRKSTRLN